MHLQTFLPALALPEAEAVADLLAPRVPQCLHGSHNKVGAGCPPGQRKRTSCSADDSAVVSTNLRFSRMVFPKCEELRFANDVSCVCENRSSVLGPSQSGRSRTSASLGRAPTIASAAIKPPLGLEEGGRLLAIYCNLVVPDVWRKGNGNVMPGVVCYWGATVVAVRSLKPIAMLDTTSTSDVLETFTQA